VKQRKSILLAGMALLALVAGVAAGWINDQFTAPQPPKLKAATALLGQAKPLPPFSLVDDQGQTFDNRQLAGRWSFLFFGYAHCPDICPATLQTMDAVLRSIGKHGHARDTQVVFVSIDPQRDTPTKLRAYVNYFNPRFVGVTGKQAALGDLTEALGILRMRLPQTKGEYLMNHSASILLVGPSGKQVAQFSAPHKAQWVASDFEALRNYYEQG
jgi:protein SCO1/2